MTWAEFGMDEISMRRRVADARVARVGTIDERGRVHLVPVVFAVDGDTWYSPSDAGDRPAKRLRNLLNDPRVSILIDVYDEAWANVWWVRLRGRGRVVAFPAESELARRLLREKYPQFANTPSDEGAGPIMAVDLDAWAGWAYAH
jgi:PPOX class probable F420-dependent enzyme